MWNSVELGTHCWGKTIQGGSTGCFRISKEKAVLLPPFTVSVTVIFVCYTYSFLIFRAASIILSNASLVSCHPRVFKPQSGFTHNSSGRI